MTKEELANYIEQEISYDRDITQRFWLRHHEVLAGNIALQVSQALHLKLELLEDVYDVLCSAVVTGNKETDAKALADAIWSELFYEEVK